MFYAFASSPHVLFVDVSGHDQHKAIIIEVLYMGGSAMLWVLGGEQNAKLAVYQAPRMI